MPNITTSTAATATAYSNQRKLDRCQNGVLWAMNDNGLTSLSGGMDFSYSTDGGATWIAATGFTYGSVQRNHTPNGSFFIDLDDYAHVVYVNAFDGDVYYRRGTPNVGRTAYTWSAAHTIHFNTDELVNYPDIVAHREGTGWRAHIVGSMPSEIRYMDVTITSGSVITVAPSVTMTSATYASTTYMFPSIDFHHTGDGKTVAGGTPHLYVTWSTGATGAGNGIRFKKATWAASAWTWGTEESITTTAFAFAGRISSAFDGTRVLILYVDSGSTSVTRFYEHVPDGATTFRTHSSPGDGVILGVSVTHDTASGAYLTAIGTTSGDAKYIKYDRSAGTWNNWTAFAAGTVRADTLTTRRAMDAAGVDVVYTDGTASPYDVVFQTSIAAPPPLVATSTATTATAYSNQRKVDRCQNGVLWSMFWDGTNTTFDSMEFWYSTDDGATWTHGTGNDSSDFGFSGTKANYTPDASLFIDLDDYAHVAYRDSSTGYVMYRRGTPDATRTKYTWSAATEVRNDARSGLPDLVAHREGVEWAVHIVYSWGDGGKTSTDYRKITVAPGGALTTGPLTPLGGTYSGSVILTYPSIDFNHTGDGKTVAGGLPHLYAAWSAGQTGAGFGIRFKKATYSGGTWTWGTEREIDSTRYVNTSARWLNCLFDGTRVVIGGALYNSTAYDVVQWDRDAADTTTSALRQVLMAQPSDLTYNYGSLTYDNAGNIYIFGRWYNGSEFVLGYRKWLRSSETLDTWVTIDSTSIGNSYISAKRGYSNNLIEFIYTDGTASPYDVIYGSIITSTTIQNLYLGTLLADAVYLGTTPARVYIGATLVHGEG